eukprot:m.966223 g.966223  ORF g.966223 m.966223 type:complete len:300 (-) comp23912_c0_seq30:1600-2499(-)
MPKQHSVREIWTLRSLPSCACATTTTASGSCTTLRLLFGETRARTAATQALRSTFGINRTNTNPDACISSSNSEILDWSRHSPTTAPPDPENLAACSDNKQQEHFNPSVLLKNHSLLWKSNTTTPCHSLRQCNHTKKILLSTQGHNWLRQMVAVLSLSRSPSDTICIAVANTLATAAEAAKSLTDSSNLRAKRNPQRLLQRDPHQGCCKEISTKVAAKRCPPTALYFFAIPTIFKLASPNAASVYSLRRRAKFLSIKSASAPMSSASMAFLPSNAMLANCCIPARTSSSPASQRFRTLL